MPDFDPRQPFGFGEHHFHHHFHHNGFDGFPFFFPFGFGFGFPFGQRDMLNNPGTPPCCNINPYDPNMKQNM